MDEIHDAQVREMHQRLDAEEEAGAVDEDTGSSSQSISGSQAKTTDESQRTESQRTQSQRTDFQNTVITMDFDDNDPLPDIVRDNFGNDQKKDFDNVWGWSILW